MIVIYILFTFFIAIYIIGFSNPFLNRTLYENQYVSYNSYMSNLNKQAKWDLQVILKLRELKVTEHTELKLEYFFYTNNILKAKNLSKELEKLNYTVNYERSAGEKNSFVITGWTTKFLIQDSVICEWTKKMCQLGYLYDCDFDGWETTPDQ